MVANVLTPVIIEIKLFGFGVIHLERYTGNDPVSGRWQRPVLPLYEYREYYHAPIMMTDSVNGPSGEISSPFQR